jgi:nitrogen fixation NifU-like protein
MADSFDDFVKDLQNQLFYEALAAYGEVEFQRWLKPLYRGAIHDADGYGRVTGTCGDTMAIFFDECVKNIQLSFEVANTHLERNQNI